MEINEWTDSVKEKLVGIGFHPLDASNIIELVLSKYEGIPDDTIDIIENSEKNVTELDIKNAVVAWYSDIKIPEKFRELIDAFNKDLHITNFSSINKIMELQSFVFFPNKFEYTNIKGETISLDTLVDIIDNDAMQAETMLIALTQLYLAKLITIQVWYEAVYETLKTKNIQYGALGAGGWRQLDDNELNIIDSNLLEDRKRLLGFALDLVLGRYLLESGKYQIAAIMERLGMYIGSARRMFWSLIPKKQEYNKVIIEKRMLRPAEHCTDCIGYSQAGWQLAGILPDPGFESVCLSNCRCVKHYKQINSDELNAWIGTMR